MICFACNLKIDHFFHSFKKIRNVSYDFNDLYTSETADIPVVYPDSLIPSPIAIFLSEKPGCSLIVKAKRFKTKP